MADVMPKLRTLFNSTVDSGPGAREHYRQIDAQMLTEEQNMMVPVYKALSPTTAAALDATVRQTTETAFWGRLFGLIKVPPIRGSVLNLEDRWQYGMNNMGYGRGWQMPDASAGYKDGSMLQQALAK
jgi:hypothetical protein